MGGGYARELEDGVGFMGVLIVGARCCVLGVEVLVLWGL